MHIFLDESGQFTKHNNDRYFVVGSFTVGDHRRTEKKFKGWCRTKFPRKMKFQDEIKFSQNNIDDALRLRTIKFISKLDVRIRYTFLNRLNIPEEYRKKKKIQSGILYTEVIGETVKMYMPISDIELRVFCDQRKLMGMTKLEFEDFLTIKLMPQMPPKSLFSVNMLESNQEPNIQIADWITGTLARYHEGKPLGKELFQLLKNNIIDEGQELFADHWQKNRNKKLN